MLYTLSNDDMRFSIEFTSQIFADKEPTSVACGVTSDEFTDVFRSIMENSVLSGHSYASHSECGDAVVLNLPYDQFRVAYNQSRMVGYNMPIKFEPMFALFDAMKYEPIGKCLYMFSIVSTGRGLASQVLQHTIDEAKAHGFTSILADCTNIKSQKLLETHGFVTRFEITYGDFEHKGVYSFKNVSTTRSIKMMELMI